MKQDRLRRRRFLSNSVICRVCRSPGIHEAFKDRTSVTIRTRWKGAERCYNFDIGDESQEAVVSVSYDADAPKLTLTPFAFDPISGSRYFAAEAGETRWGLLVSPGHPTSVEDSSASGLRISLALEPGDCPAAEARRIQLPTGQNRRSGSR